MSKTRCSSPGERDRSTDLLARAASRPGDVSLQWRAGRYLIERGEQRAALPFLRRVTAAAPRAPGGHLALGGALLALGERAAAEASLRRAIACKPDMVQAWHNLGNLLQADGRLDEAAAAYRRALAIHPLPLTRYNLANSLVRQNRAEEAAALIRLDDPDPAMRWQALRTLPIIYRSEEELRRWRERYRAGLLALSRGAALDSVAAARAVAAGIQDAFNLHYQGGAQRDLQALHGGLIARVMAAGWPGLHRAPLAAPPAPGERIRVGFASSMLRDHTVAKLFGGWIRGLDRRRFEVRCYHIGAATDAVSRRLAGACAGFVHSPVDPIAAARRIAADRPHALIFPELGMDAAALKLAGLRLAPLQCVAWGHPITTGLPTVDAFLSSEAMEPEGAEAHYTEALVRLPGLSVQPEPPPPARPDRARFGLGQGDRVFLIAQSLFKLLPRHDWIYPAIAARVPGARFVFIARFDQRVNQDFLERLAAAFTAAGQDFGAVHTVPKLSWSDYLSLNASADVFLDSPGWSGGVTTLEALATGLVPVTLPGPLMRQRHTAAILAELGVTETVADSAERYVECAARLALEPAWRGALAARLGAALPSLYRDERGLRALEAFIERRLRQRAPGPAHRAHPSGGPGDQNWK